MAETLAGVKEKTVIYVISIRSIVVDVSAATRPSPHASIGKLSQTSVRVPRYLRAAPEVKSCRFSLFLFAFRNSRQFNGQYNENYDQHVINVFATPIEKIITRMKFVAISQNQIQFQLQINQFPEFVQNYTKL